MNPHSTPLKWDRTDEWRVSGIVSIDGRKNFDEWKQKLVADVGDVGGCLVFLSAASGSSPNNRAGRQSVDGGVEI